MAQNKPTVVVSGVTGWQGSAVAKALLKTGAFHVKGIVRNIHGKQARKMIHRGVELAQGDLTRPDDVRRALEGAYAFFAHTHSYDPIVREHQEGNVGKRLVDEAKNAGIQHFVWSTLPDVHKLSDGKYDGAHFSEKASVEAYARESGLHCTFISAAFYYQNFATIFPVMRDEKGRIVFSTPLPESAILTAVDVEDMGPVVAQVLMAPEKWEGKTIALAGDSMRPDEYASIFKQATGMCAIYKPMHMEHHQDEESMQEIFSFMAEYGYYGGKAAKEKEEEQELVQAREIWPGMKTWREWLQTSGWRGEKIDTPSW
ncbi:hypothetical protein QOT17_018323 [Balamuthia mandrillaris]